MQKPGERGALIMERATTRSKANSGAKRVAFWGAQHQVRKIIRVAHETSASLGFTKLGLTRPRGLSVLLTERARQSNKTSMLTRSKAGSLFVPGDDGVILFSGGAVCHAVDSAWVCIMKYFFIIGGGTGRQNWQWHQEETR